MRRAQLILPVFALAVATAASAQIAPPQRKPGMWEMNMVNSTVKGMAIKSQMCTDSTVEKRFSAIGGGQGPENCSTNNLRKTPTGYAFESVCKSPRGVSTTSGVVTGDFQTNYKIEMTSKMTPTPPGAPPVMNSTVSAKWLGPCPAGRKPGDMVMPNGMVMNMMALPANGPGAGPERRR